MKNIFTFFAFIFAISTLKIQAQAPQKISYQAVVRDSKNELIASTSVGVKISIIQGSVSGAVAYSETHNPTTNMNGLFSVEIGGGSIISGSFAAINWANGPFYIKSEIDPTGGINYTIEGTSQLVSVPYALYAEKAGNAFSGDYNDLTNKPNFATQKALDDSMAILRNLIRNLDSRISKFELKVGDFKDGGIVGYLFQPGDAGYVEGEEHGLIVALEETPKKWSAGIFTNVIGTSDTIGAGVNNTDLIISSSGGNNAASYCRDLVSEGFEDWFLPSKNEFIKIWENRNAINNGLAKKSATLLASTQWGEYWTSTQQNDQWGVALVYNTGETRGSSKSNESPARPVRKF